MDDTIANHICENTLVFYFYVYWALKIKTCSVWRYVSGGCCSNMLLICTTHASTPIFVHKHEPGMKKTYVEADASARKICTPNSCLLAIAMITILFLHRHIFIFVSSVAKKGLICLMTKPELRVDWCNMKNVCSWDFSCGTLSQGVLGKVHNESNSLYRQIRDISFFRRYFRGLWKFNYATTRFDARFRPFR